MQCLRWGSNPQTLNLKSSTLPLSNWARQVIIQCIIKTKLFEGIHTISTTSTSACIRSWYIKVCKSFFICIVLSSSSDSLLSNDGSHLHSSFYTFWHENCTHSKEIRCGRSAFPCHKGPLGVNSFLLQPTPFLTLKAPRKKCI